MGLYAFLNLKSSTFKTPVEESIIESKECKFGLPVAWVALFNKSDIESDNICLVCSVSDALSNLDQRSESLFLVFDSAWSDGFGEFIGWLKHPESTHIELDLTDLYGDQNAHEFEDHFASLLDTFEEPLYKGKTLFSVSFGSEDCIKY